MVVNKRNKQIKTQNKLRFKMKYCCRTVGMRINFYYVILNGYKVESTVFICIFE